MALVKNDLEQGVFDVISTFPGTPAAAASGLASAYDDYALAAQSCAGLTPTLVFKALLQDGLEDSLKDPFPADAEAAAEDWRDALVLYWTGALFGATGTVVLPISGAVALKGALQTIFEAVSVPILFPAKAASLATAIDAFTRTVQVTDSGVPCGPSPIT